MKDKNNIGKVYRGRTKFIDVETKLERNYVVVSDNGKNISVSKLKSVKQFDKDGRNIDKHLHEINYERYGLSRRTGVDSQVFYKNRMTGKKLSLSDPKVFPEQKPRFSLGPKDLHKTLVHTGRF